MPLGQPSDIDEHHPVLRRDHSVRKAAGTHQQITANGRGAHGSAQPFEKQIEAAPLDPKVSEVFHRRCDPARAEALVEGGRGEFVLGSRDCREAPEFGIHRTDLRVRAELAFDACEVVGVEQVVIIKKADPIGPRKGNSRIARGRDPRLLDCGQVDRAILQRRGRGIIESVGDHDDLIERPALPERAVDRLYDEVGAPVGGDYERERAAGFSPTLRTTHPNLPRVGMAMRGIVLHLLIQAAPPAGALPEVYSTRFVVLAMQNRTRTITAHAHHLTIATIATDTPMGAQAYQEQIAQRARAALIETDSNPWTVDRAIVRSLRSKLPGNRRLPMSRVATASARTRRLIGRGLYGSGTTTHRMNLELPPAPHGDVVTLHDIVAWLFPDESAPVAAAAQELRDADALICVSEFTASEASTFLGVHNSHVIHNGVDERFFGATALSKDGRRALGIGDEYILHAGGASARKNLEALAEAWPTVHRERPGLQLVLSGPPHPRRTRLFAEMPGTLLVGRVEDAVVPGLVAAATAVVVPSLYEGFGLPVLEAMAAGVPVVAANTSSLPEVSGSAAILVDPTARGVAEGLITVTAGDTALAALVRRGRARAQEFTWERSAREHARVWRSVA